MNDHYSNDKIDLLLSDIKNINVNQNKTLDRIETQTIKTNGRVSKLEEVNSNREGQNKVIVWIVGIFLIILATISGYFFSQIQTLTNRQTKIYTQLNLK